MLSSFVLGASHLFTDFFIKKISYLIKNVDKIANFKKNINFFLKEIEERRKKKKNLEDLPKLSLLYHKYFYKKFNEINLII